VSDKPFSPAARPRPGATEWSPIDSDARAHCEDCDWKVAHPAPAISQHLAEHHVAETGHTARVVRMQERFITPAGGRTR